MALMDQSDFAGELAAVGAEVQFVVAVIEAENFADFVAVG